MVTTLRATVRRAVGRARRARERRALVSGRLRMPVPVLDPLLEPVLESGHRTPAAAVPPGHFVNPVAEGADPYVVRHGASYLWCSSDGDRGVAVSRSDRPTSQGERRVVWRAPASGPCAAQIWAPELHLLDGRWFIYLAGSDGRNEQHRTFVLAADTDDPMGDYTLHGPLATGDDGGPDRWAIDATVLEHGGRRFAIWSGWPGAEETAQHLYLAPLAGPTRLAGPRVLISSSADHPWERVPGDRPRPASINEGPQVLRRDGRTFLLYSASSALTSAYCMGLLELVGDDPAVPASWRKHPEPVLRPTAAMPGVGHGVPVVSPDGSEDWWVFHAKIADDHSFRRAVHLQPLPALGELIGGPGAVAPLPPGPALRAPAGAPSTTLDGATLPRRWDFTSPTDARDALAGLDVLAHHQLVARDGGLVLGRVPSEPVNAYRCGEKVVLRDGAVTDVEVRVRLAPVEGAHRRGSAGVLLRVTGCALGHHAQRGYYLGYDLRRRELVVERHDGVRAERLAGHAEGGSRNRPRRPHRHPPAGGVVELLVTAVGERLTVELVGTGERLVFRDESYGRGSLGLRVDDAAVRFLEWGVEPTAPSTPQAPPGMLGP